MPKLLIRIVAIFLVPCLALSEATHDSRSPAVWRVEGLIADPTSAAALYQQGLFGEQSSKISSLHENQFEEQALVAGLTYFSESLDIRARINAIRARLPFLTDQAVQTFVLNLIDRENIRHWIAPVEIERLQGLVDDRRIPDDLLVSSLGILRRHSVGVQAALKHVAITSGKLPGSNVLIHLAMEWMDPPLMDASSLLQQAEPIMVGMVKNKSISKYVYHYTSVPRLRQVFLSGGYLDPKLAIPEEGTLADPIYGFGVVLFFSPVPLGDIGRMNFGDDAITLEFDRDRLEGARFNEQDYTTYNRVPLRGLTERSKREVLRRLGESFRDALGYYGPLYDESAEIIAEPAAGPGVDYSLEPEELAEVRSHVQSGGTITVVRPDDAYPTTVDRNNFPEFEPLLRETIGLTGTRSAVVHRIIDEELFRVASISRIVVVPKVEAPRSDAVAPSLPKGNAWKVIRKAQGPEGWIYTARRFVGWTCPTEDGSVRPGLILYPGYLRQFGFIKNQDGSIDYLDINGLNTRFARQEIPVRFYATESATGWEQFVAGFSEGDVAHVAIAANGYLHFHDLFGHVILYSVLTEKLLAWMRAPLRFLKAIEGDLALKRDPRLQGWLEEKLADVIFHLETDPSDWWHIVQALASADPDQKRIDYLFENLKAVQHSVKNLLKESEQAAPQHSPKLRRLAGQIEQSPGTSLSKEQVLHELRHGAQRLLVSKKERASSAAARTGGEPTDRKREKHLRPTQLTAERAGLWGLPLDRHHYDGTSGRNGPPMLPPAAALPRYIFDPGEHPYASLQHAAYEKAWQITESLDVPKPAGEDHPALDISLDTGFGEAVPSDSDYPNGMVDQLVQSGQELYCICPLYKIPSGGMFHQTVFEVLHKDLTSDPSRYYEEVRDQLNERFYEPLVDAVNSVGPFQVVLQGLNLMPNGTVIVQGYVLDDRLQNLRNRLSAAYPEEDWRENRFFQLTLGRPPKGVALSRSQFMAVRDWVRTNRHLYFGTFTVKRPRLVAVANQHATVLHDRANEDLKPINERIGPRADAREFLDQYFLELRRLSVPEEGLISSDIAFFGNERIPLESIQAASSVALKGPNDRVMVGTAIGLALEYGFAADADTYIIDRNKVVTEVIYPVLLLLYERHPERLSFFADILSVNWSTEDKAALEGASPDEIVFHAQYETRPSKTKLKQTVQTLAKLLGPYVSADVRPEIVPILSGFLQSFYPLEVLASVGIKPGTFHGDFDTNRRQPMPEIGRIHGTLASQKQYSKARLRSRRIHVATGNMIGQGLRRVAGDIASNKKRISLFYPSNIPEYMHVPQDYFRFFEAARDLPLAENAQIILTEVGGTKHICMPVLQLAQRALQLRDVVSSYSPEYRASLVRALIAHRPEFLSGEMPLRLKLKQVADLHVQERPWLRHFTVSQGEITRAESLYQHFDRDQEGPTLREGQFVGREQFQHYLNTRGFSAIDPFDFAVVATALEWIGVIESRDGPLVQPAAAPGESKRSKREHHFSDATKALEDKVLPVLSDAMGRTQEEVCEILRADGVNQYRVSLTSISTYLGDRRNLSRAEWETFTASLATSSPLRKALETLLLTAAARPSLPRVAGDPENASLAPDPSDAMMRELVELLQAALSLAFSSDARQILSALLEPPKQRRPRLLGALGVSAFKWAIIDYFLEAHPHAMPDSLGHFFAQAAPWKKKKELFIEGPSAVVKAYDHYHQFMVNNAKWPIRDQRNFGFILLGTLLIENGFSGIRTLVRPYLQRVDRDVPSREAQPEPPIPADELYRSENEKVNSLIQGFVSPGQELPAVIQRSLGKEEGTHHRGIVVNKRYTLLGDAVLDLILMQAQWRWFQGQGSRKSYWEFRNELANNATLISTIIKPLRKIGLRLDDYADYKLPADLFEALVGAVYECNGGTLGTGIEQAARFAVSYWKPYVGRPKRKKPHLIMFLDALTESLAAAPRTTKAEKRGGSEGKNNVLLFAGPGAFHPAGLILVALILGTAFFKDEILSSSWYKKLPNSWWGVAIRFVIINLPNHSDIRHQFVRFVSAAIDWLEDVLLRLPVSLSLPRSGHTLLRAA